MLKNVLLVASIVVYTTACTNQECGNKKGATSMASAAVAGTYLGDSISAEGALAFEELYVKMNGIDSLPIKLTGTVGEVCQKKGCWMTLVSSNGDIEPMRVTFKDYAFFMPKDLAGKKVVIDGYAYTETTPVETLRHYAEDAGKSPEEIAKITEPKREISYEARGVIILNQ